MDPTFTLLPLSMDPSSKAISCSSPSSDIALTASLTQLNILHRILIGLPAPPGQAASTTPPPATSVNPKRSQQIQKMREQANTAMKKASGNQQQAQEAAKLYTFALQIALSRPPFEPSQLLREEASTLYANRAQAYMAASQWAEGAADAACSVELKRQGNGKAWWRRGKCLTEMGRWEDARAWVKDGRAELENENAEGARELKELEFEIRRRLERDERAES